jgi:hypothetical protein
MEAPVEKPQEKKNRQKRNLDRNKANHAGRNYSYKQLARHGFYRLRNIPFVVATKVYITT